ncbi:hypothetical protein QFZ97_004233 [Paraburkholderia youngii]
MRLIAWLRLTILGVSVETYVLFGGVIAIGTAIAIWGIWNLR